MKILKFEDIPRAIIKPNILVLNQDVFSYYKEHILSARLEYFNKQHSNEIIENKELFLEKLKKYEKKSISKNLVKDFLEACESHDLGAFFFFRDIKVFSLFFISRFSIENIVEEIENNLEEEETFLSNDELKQIVLEELKNRLLKGD
jgi:hypothetical protein